jgi:hypothetical protein
MASLNRGTRAAVDSLQVKLERVENEFSVFRAMQDSKFQLLIDSNDRLTQAIRRLTNPIVAGIVNHTAVIPHPPAPPINPNNQPAPAVDSTDGPQDFPAAPDLDDDTDVAIPQVVVDPPVPPAVGTETTRHGASLGHLVDLEFRRRAQADATQVIDSVPIAPPLHNSSCPPTWVKCLRDWRGNNLSFWSNAPKEQKDGWSNKIGSAYRKRLSIHTEIERYMASDNAEGDMSRPLCTLDLAAEALDTLRRASGSNLTDHLNSRRKANPVKQRRRSRNPNPPPAPVPPPPPPLPQPAAAVAPLRFSNAYVGADPDIRGRGPPTGVGNVPCNSRRNWVPRVPEPGDCTLAQLGEQDILAESERRRTQGTLLYRFSDDPDRRNHNGMGLFERNQHGRNQLNRVADEPPGMAHPNSRDRFARNLQVRRDFFGGGV